ncbi:MAG: preprotein translocase subunit SecY [Oscillospiraceae bacterium]|nr:preprotein translocase subunit SecY [Oscillospiraceae bacterium]
MFRTFANAWKIVDLRKKILFTAFIILIYRIGSAMPVPFVDIATTGGLFGEEAANTFMTYLSMMTGNAFNYGTLFALSITPYINASIIIQLLTVAIPYLQKLSQEGEEGRKKMNRITRYSALFLGLLQSVAYYFFIRAQGYLATNADGKAYTGFFGVFQGIIVVLCYTAGTVLVMWLGERINEKGIGNGISIILFAGIVARMPTTITNLYQYINRGGAYFGLVPVAAIALIGMIFFIVWMDNAERRIPVQYAKRVVGRKMYGGQNTHMPIKVNMCGVLPVIFASSILSILPTIAMFAPGKEGSFWYKLSQVWLGQTHPFYGTLYFIFIIFFAYFYAAIQYNPIEMADNLRKNSGSVPGIRPGKPTSTYIQKILNRITLIGALLLSVVAMFPIIYSQVAGIFTENGMNLAIGGTSIIIMVGVALETQKQLESQMMMRHYKGFLD